MVKKVIYKFLLYFVHIIILILIIFKSEIRSITFELKLC